MGFDRTALVCLALATIGHITGRTSAQRLFARETSAFPACRVSIEANIWSLLDSDHGQSISFGEGLLESSKEIANASCRFAFNSEIRRVGCRKATFFAIKGEMPIRFARCSLIPACERGAKSGARYDRRWRANGLPCERSGARRPWRTLSGPVPSPSQPAARPCKRCLTLRGKNLDFIGKISHLAAKDCNYPGPCTSRASLIPCLYGPQRS